MHLTSPLGGGRQNIALTFAITFGTEKIEWCGYLKVKKLKICLFVLTECMHERDRQTDRHCMTAKSALA